MAVPFKLDDAGRNFSSKGKNAVFEDYIYDRLASAMKIDRSGLSKDDVDIQLIGAGRDVYEGGKPSCFYQITIKNMDSKEYLVKTKKFLSSNRHEEVLDSNKRVYVVDFKTILWHKDKSLLTFKVKREPDKAPDLRLSLQPEKNLIANLYHYIRFNKL